MKTADQILAEHEDANEMHFHQVDREWVIKAMEEYAASRQVRIRPQDQMPKDGEPVLIADIVGRSEQFYCVSSNSLVYGKPCEKWCGDENCKALCKQ